MSLQRVLETLNGTVDIEGAIDTVRDDLIVEIRRIKTLADEAWDKTAKAGAYADDATANFQRGKAHAYCEVLGDQEALSRLID